MFPLPASYSGISRLQDQFNTLQTQLSTGQKAATLADMGNTRFTDLTVRSKLSRISAYDTNIGTVNLRLDTMNQVLTSLSKINSSARSASTVGEYGTNNVNLSTAPSLAQQQLDQSLTMLNTDLNGHYLFGGGATQTAPVATTDAVMNGTGTLAGFKTVAAQRLQADQGADGMGRLQFTTPPTAPDAVTLNEDGAHPFGYKLASVSSASTDFTLTQPSGTAPHSLSIQVATQPADGDSLTVELKLPDGTSDSINL